MSHTTPWIDATLLCIAALVLVIIVANFPRKL